MAIEKGLVTLTEIFRDRTNARLKIVGDGPYRAEMQAQLPIVEFTGMLRGEALSEAYASGDVFHAGRFPDLEDQMFAMTRAGYMGDRSPDRVDALVWALTELMLAGSYGERVKVGFG